MSRSADDHHVCAGSSLAIVTARTRQPVMPSNYTIIQYFSSFIEDPLFENITGESKYASAKTCYEEKVLQHQFQIILFYIAVTFTGILQNHTLL